MKTIVLDQYGSQILYHSDWLANKMADQFFSTLKQKVHWQQENIKFFGKFVKTPRLVAYYGDQDAQYSYSGTMHSPMEWLAELRYLRDRLLAEYELAFNSVLVNLYRNGLDYMGWHSDAEKSLGRDPVIASISLGAKRRFLVRDKSSQTRQELALDHGSLLIMTGPIQHYWQHSIPKTKKINESRINLTFRKIIYKSNL